MVPWILLGLTIFLTVVWGFEYRDRRKGNDRDRG